MPASLVERWRALPTRARVLIVAGAVVGAYGLWVGARRQREQSAGEDGVDAADEFARLEQRFGDIAASIYQAQAEGNRNLADLIATSTSGMRDALNEQTAAFLAGFREFGEGLRDRLGEIDAGLVTRLRDLQEAVIDSVVDEGKAIRDLFGDLDEGVKDSIAKLTGLQSEVVFNRDLMHYNLGAQSFLSCRRGNNWEATCLKVKGYVGGASDPINRNEVARFDECWNGSTYDYLCVGRKILAKGGGGGSSA